MTISYKKILSTAVMLTASVSLSYVSAQEQTTSPAEAEVDVITIQPLFEYPMAPEDIESLEGKSNWLMQHFWDKMDFKSKSTVDQNALNDAFYVYSNPMAWADREEVIKSTDILLKQLEKNPTLLLQFTKAAENMLYDPQRARMLIDEIYIKYLESLLKAKKIPETRKARYRHQYNTLVNSMIDSTPNVFDFTAANGDPKKYRPYNIYTIIEFGNPTCADCRISRLKLETNAALKELVDKGLVNILFIIPDAEEGWQTEVAGYPSSWSVGASDTVSDLYDIRLTPTFYIIDSENKVMAKNISVNRVIELTLDKFKDRK